jgi:CubicO group peptidase (beta-lactamase class C family)
MIRIPFCLLSLAVGMFAADWPTGEWPAVAPDQSGLNSAILEQARDYALTGGGSGIVIHKGRSVILWGDQKRTYDLKSSSKSIGGTALGLALLDQKVRLDDRAITHQPTFGTPPSSNAKKDWLGRITLRMLANQSAGFDKPGGYEKLLFAPGTKWNYSDGGPNWLAEILTLKYGRDLNEVLFERVFQKIGITPKDLRWRSHAYRPKHLNGIKRREFGSGFHANVPAMARIGYLYLRDGWWQGEKILPREFIHAIRNPDPNLAKLETLDSKNYGPAAAHYGMLWWNNRDGSIPDFPRDASWSWGLHDSLIAVVPSLDLVVARAGKSWQRKGWDAHYSVLGPFLRPLAAAVKLGKNSPPPTNSSPTIRTIHWAPKETIIRHAKGSDNWPLTWADDGNLYTAYGDGWGFRPMVKGKLSLGLARIEGSPPNIKGINLRSATAESIGGGKHGRKASGMLMANGTLFMWVRNAANSQLGWSTDRGKTWNWATWRFEESFGCPTFLNFGQNYAGARDDFVYVYSQDSDTAYDRADRFVMARVKLSRIRQKESYEYFAGLASDRPRWSVDIKDRAAVFSNPGACYRSSLSYHPGLKRYLWCQTGSGDDTRFAGAFSILDAPEPWGPWSKVFHTDQWDVGPGESMHLPTNWMTGNTLWLVFSGDDHFSMRKGEIVLY